MTTVLSQKGQIVLPAVLREKMGLCAGDDFEVESEDGETIVLRRITRRPNEGLLEHLRACPFPFEIPEREDDLPREVEIE